jgi:hypothetical protein
MFEPTFSNGSNHYLRRCRILLILPIPKQNPDHPDPTRIPPGAFQDRDDDLCHLLPHNLYLRALIIPRPLRVVWQ